MSTFSNPSLGDACRDGDMEAARRALDQIKTSTAINPQANSIQTQVAQKAALLSAQNGHLSTFLLLHSQFCESILTEDVVRRITENEDRLEFCDALIKRGWDLNKPYGKKTPLSHALSSFATAQLLLEHGADPKVPHDLTSPKYCQDIPILSAAGHSAPSVVRLLIEHGSPVSGTCALHHASMESGQHVPNPESPGRDIFKKDLTRVEVLRMLLDAGADANEMMPDPKGPNGRGHRDAAHGTPLHWAVRVGVLETVECLLEYGADVDAPSWSGCPALQSAEREFESSVQDGDPEERIEERREILELMRKYKKMKDEREKEGLEKEEDEEKERLELEEEGGIIPEEESEEKPLLDGA